MTLKLLQTVTNTDLETKLDLETYMRSLNPEPLLAKIQQLHQNRKSENKVALEGILLLFAYSDVLGVPWKTSRI